MTADASAETLPSQAAIAPGQVIGERYLVGELLGGGGMGVVYAGTHVLLGTPIAIKLIHAELRDDVEAVQRFVNEARATAKLKGEHIARVFDVGLLDSREPYLVMEQLEGVALDHYLHERGPLSVGEAVDIVLQACEGLAEAHAAGLVHRDIKPANLFLARRPDGLLSLKILDFGIAKQRVGSPHAPALTDPGKSLGSPWYMSPEQMLTPASVDERADVWSLGVLLFELLTGQRPFEGENVPQVCANVLTASVPALERYRSDLPPALDAVVQRCLEKEPARRFAGVAELARALGSVVAEPASIPVVVEPETPGSGVYELRREPSYGSLTPLQRGAEYDEPVAFRERSWPRALLLVACGCLALAGFFTYRDPSLPARAQVALAQLVPARFSLPWEPRLQPVEAARELEPEREPAQLLQVTHAEAVPERERVEASAPERLSPEEVRARVERYEAWLRAQGLQRLEEAEQE